MSRFGPTPLPLHLSLAASACMQHDDKAEDMLQDFLAGLKAYQLSAYKTAGPDYETVWQAGEAQIFTLQEKESAQPILLVPSIINRSNILDIHPERSMMRYLEASLLDWGKSIDDPAQQNIDMLLLERLIPALEEMVRIHGQPVHALGYCLGGTLLLAAAQLRPDLIASLILLASPWDFHAGDQTMRRLVKTLAPSAAMMMAGQGKLGGVWTQSLFAMLEPEKTVRKFARFARMDQGTLQAEIFTAVEDWLNTSVDLPFALAQTVIQDWYMHNTPAADAWEVNGVRIDPSRISCPVYIVNGKRDKLVPSESSASLAGSLKNADHVMVDCGHIGLIASEVAPQQIWTPIKKRICM